jgi:hypothetical protein
MYKGDQANSEVAVDTVTASAKDEAVQRNGSEEPEDETHH